MSKARRVESTHRLPCCAKHSPPGKLTETSKNSTRARPSEPLVNESEGQKALPRGWLSGQTLAGKTKASEARFCPPSKDAASRLQAQDLPKPKTPNCRFVCFFWPFGRAMDRLQAASDTAEVARHEASGFGVGLGYELWDALVFGVRLDASDVVDFLFLYLCRCCFRFCILSQAWLVLVPAAQQTQLRLLNPTAQLLEESPKNPRPSNGT